MNKYIPFKEGQCQLIGDLTIENIDANEITVYGDITINHDEHSVEQLNKIISILTEIKDAIKG